MSRDDLTQVRGLLPDKCLCRAFTVILFERLRDVREAAYMMIGISCGNNRAAIFRTVIFIADARLESSCAHTVHYRVKRIEKSLYLHVVQFGC